MLDEYDYTDRDDDVIMLDQYVFTGDYPAICCYNCVHRAKYTTPKGELCTLWRHRVEGTFIPARVARMADTMCGDGKHFELDERKRRWFNW